MPGRVNLYTIHAGETDRLLRKAAFLRSYLNTAELTEVRNWTTKDLTISNQPPQVIKKRAERQYESAKLELAGLLRKGNAPRIGAFMERQKADVEEGCARIADLQKKVTQRNKNNAWWLWAGQITAGGVGVAAGIGLAVLTLGGATAVIGAAGTAATAAEVTFAGLQVGTTSTIAFGTTGFGLRQAVNAVHSWSESSGVDVIAVTTPGEGASLDGTPPSTTSVGKLIGTGKDWLASNAPLAVASGLTQYALEGPKTVIPVVGFSLAFKREIEAGLRADETPQERAERLSESR